MNKQSRHATVEERCVTQPVKKETKQLQVVYRLHVWFILFLDFYFLSLSLPLSPPLSPPLSLSPPPLSPPLSLSLSPSPPPLSLSLSLSLPDKNLSSGHLLVSSTLLALDRKCSRWSVLEGDTESLDTYLSRELVFWQCSVFTLFQKLLQISSNFASGS